MKLAPYVPLLSCFASFVGGIAYADGFVRAAARGPGIAVVMRENDTHRVDFATDGATFVEVSVEPGAAIYDAAVLDDGTLLLARELFGEPPAVEVLRVDAADARAGVPRRFATELAGFPAQWRARLAARGRHVVLANAAGAFRSDDGGRHWTRAARWDADGYGFYAASLWIDDAGGLEVLVPTFNTCGSSDLLEDLTRFALRPDGGVTRAALSFVKLDGPWGAYLGRHGFLYTAARTGPAACRLRVHAPGEMRTVARALDGPCYVTGNDNGRFTVVQVGRRLYRAGDGPTPHALGEADDGIVDVTPDSRGRALALYGDGRIVRYASTASPQVVREAP